MEERRKGGGIPVCPLCCGRGSVTIHESVCIGMVSREMAQDAGEPGMEGMPMLDEHEVESPCALCDGSGVQDRRDGERRDAWRTAMTAKDQRDDPDYAGKCYRPFEYGVQPGDRVRYVTQPDRRRAERRKGE